MNTRKTFAVTVLLIRKKNKGSLKYMLQSYVVVGRDEGEAINKADSLFFKQHRIDTYLDKNFAVIEIGEKDEEALR